MSSTFVVITGASKGIGRACAIEFAKNPIIGKLKLCLLARNLQGLSETSRLAYEASSSETSGRKEIHVSSHGVDLSIIDSLEETIENILTDSDQGHFDHYVLINNAGSLGHLGAVKAMPSPKDLQKNIELNVASSCWLSSFFLRWVDEISLKNSGTDEIKMNKDQSMKKCTVVNMSSLCAISPFPTMAAYCAGKAYRDMYHRTMAMEEKNNTNRKSDIKILNYAPGAIVTDMTQTLGECEELDSELSTFFKEKDEAKFVKVEDTSNKMIDLVLKSNFESGKHIDFWDDAAS